MLAFFPKAFAVQNLPRKTNAGSSRAPNAVIDRLTLALIDRLPTESEREFSRIHGQKGPYELAGHLIKSREFFDRLSIYWNVQLRQSPAWLWDSTSENSREHYFAGEKETSGKIFYFPPSEKTGGETVCNGVWSIFREGIPEICSCDDTVDVIPFWDSSSSMRVCPNARKPEFCGPSLANCLPVDARLQRAAANLEIDRDSAGGHAITRLISDFTLAQGRSIAVAVVNHQKWSRISNSPRTVISKSSLDLMRKWVTAHPATPMKKIASLLKIEENLHPAKTFLMPPLSSQRLRRSTRMAGETLAEELFVSPPLNERFTVQPFRNSSLPAHIWDWSTDLLLTCQIPHLAPQVFNLPLPHPESAKEGAYFCSGCHLSISQFNSDRNAGTEGEKKYSAQKKEQKTEQHRECAIDHALQYLTGYRPAGKELAGLRKKGTSSYIQNQESMALLIRDLALQIAFHGDSP
jgi:hypothetical protein